MHTLGLGNRGNEQLDGTKQNTPNYGLGNGDNDRFR